MGIDVARAQRSENVGHLAASDLMTSPAAVVQETQTVYEAAALMLQKGVGALAVVDASGAAVGMVSDGDLSGRAPDARRGTWWLELLAAGAGSDDASRRCPHSENHVGPPNQRLAKGSHSGDRRDFEGPPPQTAAGD